MACRRSQVRSLSGPPFETIRTRRKAGFLFVYFRVVGAGAFRSVKSAGGRFAVRVRAAIKKCRKAGFLLCTFAWLGQARSTPLKAGKVCVPVISP